MKGLRFFVLVSGLLGAAQPALAAVTATGDVIPLGDGFVALGDVDLSGQNLTVGDTALGTVNVSSGDTLTSTSTRIGFTPTGDGAVNVTGAGSTLDVTNFLFVGREGQSVLDITDGGLVQAGRGRIAWGAGSSADVDLSGVGSTLRVTRELSIGGAPNADGGSATTDLETDGTRLYVGDFDPATFDALADPSLTAVVVSDTDGDGGDLFLRNGAALNAVVGLFANGVVVAGLNGGETGLIRLTGAGTQAATVETFVGLNGSGTLNVFEDARYGSVRVIAGFGQGSTGEINVASGGQLVTTERVLLGIDPDNTEDPAGSATLKVAADARFYVGENDATAAPNGLVIDHGARGLPGPDDGLYVGNGSTAVSDGLAVIGLSSASASSVDVTDAGSRWTHTGNMVIGDAGSGDLDIRVNASVVTTNALVGRQAGSDGLLDLFGGNSLGDVATFQATERLVLGGDLVGGVAVPGGTAEARMVSNGKLIVGDDVPGTASNGTTLLVTKLNGQPGGELDAIQSPILSEGNTIIGYHPDETGRVRLRGVGATLSTGGTNYIGLMGTAVVEVRDQAILDDSGAETSMVGAMPGSHGTLIVDGEDSFWFTGPMDVPASVGYEGAGVLHVTGGGQTQHAGSLLIASDPGSSGDVTTTGSGSPTLRSTITVGEDLHVGGKATGVGGVAVLSVEGGSLVDVANHTVLWNQGTINLRGGELKTGSLDFRGGAVNFEFGTLRLTDPAGTSLTYGLAQQLFGTSQPTIGPNQTLITEGPTDVLVPITIDGGTLDIHTPSSLSFVDFRTGTLRISKAKPRVGDTSLFDRRLTAELGQRYEFDSEDRFRVFPDGAIELRGGTVAVRDALGLENEGRVEGFGVIEGQVLNRSSGQITVRAGERMTFVGLIGDGLDTIINDGGITLLGGELDVHGPFSTGVSGALVGEDATIRSERLFNAGSLAFTSGHSRVYGDVLNSNRVIVSGDASVTFFDDFNNLATTQVSSGATAVFFNLFGNGPTGTGTIFLEADLRPGFSPGAFTFGGDVTFGAGSRTEIELAGLTPETEHDIVAIDGQLSLGGTLEVLLIDDATGETFAPSYGDVFEIVSAAGGLTGDYSAIDLPDLGQVLDWHVGRDNTSIALSVVAALPGDFNLDGFVDAGDFSVWRDTLGEEGVGLFADGDLDGRVTVADYEIWRANFGGSLDSAPAGNVPEPAAAMMLLTYAGCLAARIRRARA
ncbi:MAG: hypothetical protein AAGJ46_10605 [Planctomycetota bacterium]